MDAPPDPYAGAKANLRENAKTLITVFGAVAGALLAGTPFAGFGALDLFTGRWLLACGSLFVAVAFLGIGLLILLQAMQPDFAYARLLGKSADLTMFRGRTLRDIRHLRDQFEAHRADLLPAGFDSVDALDADRASAFAEWQAKGTDVARKVYEDVAGNLQMIVDWASFVMLRYRIVSAMRRAFAAGCVSLVFIAIFATVVGGQKDKANPPVVFIPVPAAPK